MEKYGTVPKRFTKAWWAHYWYYYKFHAIVAAFFVFMIGSIIYSNVTAVEEDLNISYIGLYSFEEEEESELNAYLAQAIDEITENDTIDIGYVFYTMDDVKADGMTDQAEYAYQMKLSAELAEGDCGLYIISKVNIADLTGISDVFEDVTVYSSGISSEDFVCDENGRPFAVSLRNNKKLEEIGINASDMYVAVRQLYPRHEEDVRMIKVYENSVKAAELLIGE